MRRCAPGQTLPRMWEGLDRAFLFGVWRVAGPLYSLLLVPGWPSPTRHPGGRTKEHTMQAIFDSIKRELASRKFRTFAGAVLVVLLGYLEGRLTPEQALTGLVTLAVGYIGSIAAEDVASKLKQTGGSQ